MENDGKDCFSNKPTMGTKTIAVLVTIAFSVIGVFRRLLPQARQRARATTANKLVLPWLRPLRIDRVRVGIRNETPEAGYD